MKARAAARRIDRIARVTRARLHDSQRALAQAIAAADAAGDRHRRIVALIRAAGGSGQVQALAAAAGLRSMLQPAADAAEMDHKSLLARHAEAQAAFAETRLRADRLADRAHAARAEAAAEAEARESLDRAPAGRKGEL